MPHGCDGTGGSGCGENAAAAVPSAAAAPPLPLGQPAPITVTGPRCSDRWGGRCAACGLAVHAQWRGGYTVCVRGCWGTSSLATPLLLARADVSLPVSAGPREALGGAQVGGPGGAASACAPGAAELRFVAPPAPGAAGGGGGARRRAPLAVSTCGAEVQLRS